jgi:hypothetical protein
MTVPLHVDAHAAPRQGGVAPLGIMGGAIIIAGLLLQIESDIPESLRLRGAVLWILYLLPTAFYFLRPPSTRPPVPTLAILGFVHALYYAFPPVAGMVNIAFRPEAGNLIPMIDPAWDLPPALDVAMWGWIALIAGYGSAALFIPFRPAARRPLSVARLVPALWMLAALGLALEAAGTFARIPMVLGGTVGIIRLAGRFALTVLLALRTRGLLSRSQGGILTTCIVLELILLATTGSMANPMLFGLTLSFGFWIAGGKLSRNLVLGLVAAALIGVTLKGVAGEYRRQTWWLAQELTPVQEAAVMSKLLQQQVADAGVGGAIVLGAQASMRRSATLDLLADVMRRTPREIPHWDGYTYGSLVGAFVPRFLWPSKPTKEVGNQFGHRYGYIGWYDRWTSVNMPYLLEFYANFGFGGVVAGMFLTAWIIRILEAAVNRPSSGILRATAALMIIHPIFLIESDFSLVFGGLLMNGVALWALVLYLERRAAAPVRRPSRVGAALAPGLARAN